MLIQFTVENYRSFRERTVFSMRKASNVERGEDAPDVVKGTDILRCAAMYGANASGKSNFVKALRFARELVVTGVEERGRIQTHPFRLDDTSTGAPSYFEFYLRTGSDKVYVYGFAVQPDAVVSEWLSEVVGDDEIPVFYRDGKEFQFASQGEGSKDELLNLVGSATRDNQLFLRTAREFKLERFPRALADVLEWFELALKIIGPDVPYSWLIADADRHGDFRAFLGDVVNRADTGVSGVRVVQQLVSTAERLKLESSLQHALWDGDLDENGRRVHYKAEDDDWYRVELRLEHAGGASGERNQFGLEDESDGTVRLLDLSPILFPSVALPLVVVVDELDRSLHTSLSRWLIERFIAEKYGSESQLIFTTHDTNILDIDVLRQDAFWFAAKNKSGASTLYSLAEFKAEQIVELQKDLERAYLVGRFGGVPRIRGAESP
jgi:AAA15 family ATPase/GTPase